MSEVGTKAPALFLIESFPDLISPLILQGRCAPKDLCNPLAESQGLRISPHNDSEVVCLLTHLAPIVPPP